MTLHEIWTQSFVAGNFVNSARLVHPIRRASWKEGIAVDLAPTGNLMILMYGTHGQFGLNWGASADDMTANDWEQAI